jgi:hypothetical protein
MAVRFSGVSWLVPFLLRARVVPVLEAHPLLHALYLAAEVF